MHLTLKVELLLGSTRNNFQWYFSCISSHFSGSVAACQDSPLSVLLWRALLLPESLILYPPYSCLCRRWCQRWVVLFAALVPAVPLQPDSVNKQQDLQAVFLHVLPTQREIRRPPLRRSLLFAV